MIACFVIHHIYEGWQQQTGGRGASTTPWSHMAAGLRPYQGPRHTYRARILH
ncbi:hypothetical protein ACFY0Z_33380 [Streptomyces kronopolitis]|uniref:hypothetical protein n=1 Tax=Streptomyces kronopolitis TaxID=1612435 RepID=UPI0036B06E3A